MADPLHPSRCYAESSEPRAICGNFDSKTTRAEGQMPYFPTVVNQVSGMGPGGPGAVVSPSNVAGTGLSQPGIIAPGTGLKPGTANRQMSAVLNSAGATSGFGTPLPPGGSRARRPIPGATASFEVLADLHDPVVRERVPHQFYDSSEAGALFGAGTHDGSTSGSAAAAIHGASKIASALIGETASVAAAAVTVVADTADSAAQAVAGVMTGVVDGGKKLLLPSSSSNGNSLSNETPSESMRLFKRGGGSTTSQEEEVSKSMQKFMGVAAANRTSGDRGLTREINSTAFSSDATTETRHQLELPSLLEKTFNSPLWQQLETRFPEEADLPLFYPLFRNETVWEGLRSILVSNDLLMSLQFHFDKNDDKVVVYSEEIEPSVEYSEELEDGPQLHHHRSDILPVFLFILPGSFCAEQRRDEQLNATMETPASSLGTCFVAGIFPSVSEVVTTNSDHGELTCNFLVASGSSYLDSNTQDDEDIGNWVFRAVSDGGSGTPEFFHDVVQASVRIVGLKQQCFPDRTLAVFAAVPTTEALHQLGVMRFAGKQRVTSLDCGNRRAQSRGPPANRAKLTADNHEPRYSNDDRSNGLHVNTEEESVVCQFESARSDNQNNRAGRTLSALTMSASAQAAELEAIMPLIYGGALLFSVDDAHTNVNGDTADRNHGHTVVRVYPAESSSTTSVGSHINRHRRKQQTAGIYDPLPRRKRDDIASSEDVASSALTEEGNDEGSWLLDNSSKRTRMRDATAPAEDQKGKSLSRRQRKRAQRDSLSEDEVETEEHQFESTIGLTDVNARNNVDHSPAQHYHEKRKGELSSEFHSLNPFPRPYAFVPLDSPEEDTIAKQRAAYYSSMKPDAMIPVFLGLGEQETAPFLWQPWRSTGLRFIPAIGPQIHLVNVTSFERSYRNEVNSKASFCDTCGVRCVVASQGGPGHYSGVESIDATNRSTASGGLSSFLLPFARSSWSLFSNRRRGHDLTGGHSRTSNHHNSNILNDIIGAFLGDNDSAKNASSLLSGPGAANEQAAPAPRGKGDRNSGVGYLTGASTAGMSTSPYAQLARGFGTSLAKLLAGDQQRQTPELEGRAATTRTTDITEVVVHKPSPQSSILNALLSLATGAETRSVSETADSFAQRPLNTSNLTFAEDEAGLFASSPKSILNSPLITEFHPEMTSLHMRNYHFPGPPAFLLLPGSIASASRHNKLLLAAFDKFDVAHRKINAANANLEGETT